MTADLTRWTAGLVGERDPAQPLLTLRTADGRVELSGATVANWVAKDANLLVDGLGAPARVGLLLPLHWHLPCLLLAGVATGATVVVAGSAEQLAGCDAAFTTAEHADEALDAGVDEVMVVSAHPLGAPGPPVPAPLGDHARDVPGHGDRWSGPAPASWHVVAGGTPLDALPATGTGPDGRVLVTPDLAEAAALAVVLGCLRDGASLVLVPGTSALDPAAVDAERLTATVGSSVAGLPRLDGGSGPVG